MMLRQLFRIPPEKIIETMFSSDRETVLYKILPHFFMEIMKKYFRVRVEGAENLPKRGSAIIAPNHSGISGFDAMVLHHEITRASGRYPRVLMHHLLFLTKTTSIPASKLGFIEANMENGIKSLQKQQMIILFPEGEQGNFKPSSKAYQLQEFKRGFIRMALETGAPIIPTVVIGAEETHVNLSQLQLTKFLRGLVIPVPLNLIPLPSKWKIIFMDPIPVERNLKKLEDREYVRDLAFKIQDQMQKRIREEIKNRESVFL